MSADADMDKIKGTGMGVVLVHGSVETSCERPFLEVLEDAARRGYGALGAGVLDAVERAVNHLEDSPLFNAGTGSVLNRDCEIEMDAAIIHGLTNRFGAVAAITGVGHPISVARKVLEETDHVFLAGGGATRFAREKGFPEASCVTEGQYRSWQKAKEILSSGGQLEFSAYTGIDIAGSDTVGCVVWSPEGELAAGSSTGGSFLKLPGRVGDTPMLGGGIYASKACAVVCTGRGEAFIETLMAKYIDELVTFGLDPQRAAEAAILRLYELKGATGGVLVVDRQGRIGAAHNTGSFPVAVAVGGMVRPVEPVRVAT